MKGKNNKPHFNVTAGLIRLNGKLLITQRPRGSHLEGFWEFPGGKQEEGETLRECLEREITEELGIEVRAGQCLRKVDHEYEKMSISLHLFECSHLSGEIRPLEGQGMRWIPPENLSEYQFPPPDYEFIQFLKNQERNTD